MLETGVQFLGCVDLLEKEMATHSSILVWKIPWTEEPGRLQSVGWQRVRHDWSNLAHTCIHLSMGMKVKVAQSCLTLCHPMDYKSMELSRPEYWSGWPLSSPGEFPNPGIEPRSPALQADCLPVKPQRKPRNTRVGSLSLLQGIFLTQESNWGLLHCRQILYQLSYQGSPYLWV